MLKSFPNDGYPFRRCRLRKRPYDTKYGERSLESRTIDLFNSTGRQMWALPLGQFKSRLQEHLADVAEQDRAEH